VHTVVAQPAVGHAQPAERPGRGEGERQLREGRAGQLQLGELGLAEGVPRLEALGNAVDGGIALRARRRRRRGVCASTVREAE
jgi:hypothetical protein